MGKSAPNVPNTVDYLMMANAQAEIGKDLLQQQTQANRPDQFTPWGQTLWTQNPQGQWTQNVTLPPQAQEALEAQRELGLQRSQLGESLMGRAANELTAGVPWEAMVANQVGMGAEARQAAEDALYQQAVSRLDPQWEAEQQRMETQLFNQGLSPGDEAYDLAMGNFMRGRNDAYEQARRAATTAGGIEAERQFGMDMRRRQQSIAESLQRRGWTLNEVNALLSGQQVGMPGMPGFKGAGVAPTPNLMGAMQAGAQGEMDKYSAQQMQQQSLFGGLAGLGTLGLMGLF